MAQGIFFPKVLHLLDYANDSTVSDDDDNDDYHLSINDDNYDDDYNDYTLVSLMIMLMVLLTRYWLCNVHDLTIMTIKAPENRKIASLDRK